MTHIPCNRGNFPQGDGSMSPRSKRGYAVLSRGRRIPSGVAGTLRPEKIWDGAASGRASVVLFAAEFCYGKARGVEPRLLIGAAGLFSAGEKEVFAAREKRDGR